MMDVTRRLYHFLGIIVEGKGRDGKGKGKEKKRKGKERKGHSRFMHRTFHSDNHMANLWW